MKNNKILALALSLVTAVGAMGVIPQAPAKAAADIPVYRLCNTGTNEHLYTTSRDEVNMLVAAGTWRDEGIGWSSPDAGEPVYRLYHRGIDDHLYTTDTNEVNILSGQGWSRDNGGLPLFFSGGSVPVYRLNNDSSKRHLLTADANENNTLIAGRAWAAEPGIMCNSRPAQAAAPAAPAPAPTVQGTNSIENTGARYAIEARLALSGSGTGYHAKLVYGTPSSACSFGIQFDVAAQDPYKSKPIYLVENIRSNAPGMQDYKRIGLASGNAKLMLAAYADGNIRFYVDGNEVGSVFNPELVNTEPTRTYVMCEASGRKLGDTVNASFSEVKIKKDGVYNPNATHVTNKIGSNAGINVNFPASVTGPCSGTISGTVIGIPAESDWDVHYDQVSGKIEFRDF